MSWVLEQLYHVIGLSALLLFLLALLSPFEAFGWWAGWSGDNLDLDCAEAESGADPAEVYAVYLTGVGGFSGDFLARRETGFLERLADRVPGLVVVHDVFPFSVNNNPLDGERFLSWLWSLCQRARLHLRSFVANSFITWRNVFQVAVSADPRYGPIYNFGVARELAASLVRKGYRPGSGQPVVLIGYSGGAQIAVGAATYLKRTLDSPIQVVSIGGLLTDDAGIDAVDRLVHFQGTRDHLPFLGSLLYSGRWPLLPYSAWNKALREGRIERLRTGPMRHTGHGDYFSRSVHLEDGESYADHTADLVAEVLRAV